MWKKNRFVDDLSSTLEPLPVAEMTPYLYIRVRVSGKHTAQAHSSESIYCNKGSVFNGIDLLEESHVFCW